ncbi:hypothetical protein AB0H57_05515 [Micromonospora sp. NPDC050686]|uniref:hypothetical protein n=1 Tax=Micromonospora sp. NPDC050686 TaxID=3154631 RepID=UPI0033DA2681
MAIHGYDPVWSEQIRRSVEQGRDPWGRDAVGRNADAYNGGITRMKKPNIDAIDSNLAALEERAKKVEDELIALHQRERELGALRARPDTDEAKLLSRYGRRAI